jgi:hypothetical protein
MVALNLLQTRVARNSDGEFHTVNVFTSKAIQDKDFAGLTLSLLGQQRHGSMPE